MTLVQSEAIVSPDAARQMFGASLGSGIQAPPPDVVTITDLGGEGTPRVRVTGGGSEEFPWEARCSHCDAERMHVVHEVGVVAVNTRGVGNRTWPLAMLAAWAHLHWHDDEDTSER